MARPDSSSEVSPPSAIQEESAKALRTKEGEGEEVTTLHDTLSKKATGKNMDDEELRPDEDWNSDAEDEDPSVDDGSIGSIVQNTMNVEDQFSIATVSKSRNDDANTFAGRWIIRVDTIEDNRVFKKLITNGNLDDVTIRAIVKRHTHSNSEYRIATLRKQLLDWADTPSNLHRKYHWFNKKQLQKRMAEIGAPPCPAATKKASMLQSLVDFESNLEVRDQLRPEDAEVLAENDSDDDDDHDDDHDHDDDIFPAAEEDADEATRLQRNRRMQSSFRSVDKGYDDDDDDDDDSSSLHDARAGGEDAAHEDDGGTFLSLLGGTDTNSVLVSAEEEQQLQAAVRASLTDVTAAGAAAAAASHGTRGRKGYSARKSADAMEEASDTEDTEDDDDCVLIENPIEVAAAVAVAAASDAKKKKKKNSRTVAEVVSSPHDENGHGVSESDADEDEEEPPTNDQGGSGVVGGNNNTAERTEDTDTDTDEKDTDFGLDYDSSSIPDEKDRDTDDEEPPMNDQGGSGVIGGGANTDNDKESDIDYDVNEFIDNFYPKESVGANDSTEGGGDGGNNNNAEHNSTASERSSSTAGGGGSGEVVKTTKANIVSDVDGDSFDGDNPKLKNRANTKQKSLGGTKGNKSVTTDKTDSGAITKKDTVTGDISRQPMIDSNSLTILTPSVVTGIPSFNGSSSANIRNTTSRSSSSPGSGIAPCVLFPKNAAPRTGLSHEGEQPPASNKTGTAYTSPPPSGNTPGTSFSKNAVVLSASSGNRNPYTSSSPSFHERVKPRASKTAGDNETAGAESAGVLAIAGTSRTSTVASTGTTNTETKTMNTLVTIVPLRPVTIKDKGETIAPSIFLNGKWYWCKCTFTTELLVMKGKARLIPTDGSKSIIINACDHVTIQESFACTWEITERIQMYCLVDGVPVPQNNTWLTQMTANSLEASISCASCGGKCITESYSLAKNLDICPACFQTGEITKQNAMAQHYLDYKSQKYDWNKKSWDSDSIIQEFLPDGHQELAESVAPERLVDGNRFAEGSSEEDRHTVTPSILHSSTKPGIIRQSKAVWHPKNSRGVRRRRAHRGRVLGKVSMDEDGEAFNDDTGVTEDTMSLFATAAGEGTDDDAVDNIESENTRQVEQESPDDEERRKEDRKMLLHFQARITARTLAKQRNSLDDDDVEGGIGEQQTASGSTDQVGQESPDDEERRKEDRKMLLHFQARITAQNYCGSASYSCCYSCHPPDSQ